jgi:outer membrane protein OmpA-like peptidoglycan-associated protein
LGGGGGGIGGGLTGGLGGSIGRVGPVGDTIGRTTSEATARARAEARAERALRTRRAKARLTGDATLDSATRLGERRIVTRNTASANAGLSFEQRMLRTRGAVAATSRGLRRVASTASGVPVFVPSASIAAPAVPSVSLTAYPPVSANLYYEPGAVYVGSGYVDVYMDRQYQDLETGLRGTGATVTRRGNNLVVLFPADVTFAFDKSDIRPRFHGALTAFARTINAYPGTDVEIAGHTDAVGPDAYNVGLSERRGRSVADFLARRQVSATRMVVEGFGETEPVATNASAEGRAANRRVELIVHPREG